MVRTKRAAQAKKSKDFIYGEDEEQQEVKAQVANIRQKRKQTSKNKQGGIIIGDTNSKTTNNELQQPLKKQKRATKSAEEKELEKVQKQQQKEQQKKQLQQEKEKKKEQAKAQKQQEDKNKQKEKRLSRRGQQVQWKSAPSSQDVPRIDKALPGSGQRMFLIEREVIRQMDHEDGPSEKFTVLGSTKNVYHVEISRHPICDCPDFKIRQNICKHFFYVLLRVLKVEPDNPLLWQKAFLPNEVRQIYEHAAKRSNNALDYMAEKTVVSAYRKAMGQEVQSEESLNKQRPVSSDSDCGICYDSLVESSTPEQIQELAKKLAWCYHCGNSLHEECFNRWQQSSFGGTRCIYCRNDWIDGRNPASGKIDKTMVSNNGWKYMNLGKAR